MKKRVLSMLLCLVMVFSLFPSFAMAAEPIGVYAVDDAQTATYTFKSGSETVSTQVVRAGETLIEPDAPEVGEHQAFDGWYVGNDKLEFADNGELAVDTVDSDVTVNARIVNVWRVSFVDEENQNVVTTKTVNQGDSLDLTSVSYDVSSTDGNRSVVGWSATQDGEAVASPYTPNGDITLYPVIRTGFWLKFDENDDGASGLAGASYTPSQFLTTGQKPTQPANPKRAGYTFGGWYTNAACTGSQFSFNSTISDHTTLYAKWVPGNANYTIIIWKQRITDAVDAETKTWDYEVSVPKTATVGSSVGVDNQYKGYDDNSSVKLNGKTYDFMGFTYDSCDSNKTVAADGSTILNVYYTRRVITIKFTDYSGYYLLTNGNETEKSGTKTYNGKTYANSVTYKGLYGAELNFEWPVTDYSGSNMTEYDTGWYHGSGSGLSFVGNFILPDKESNDISLHGTDAGTNPVRFYKQSVDDENTWELARVVKMSGSNFSISDKFEGFTAYKYYTNNSDTYPSESSWKNATQSNVSYDKVSCYNTLHVFFKRNSYNIDFQYTNGTSARDTVVKKYQASLNDVSEAAPAYPSFLPADQYEFVGWFADPELTTYVSFSEISDAKKQELSNEYGINSFVSYAGQTMPTNNIVLYAGFFKIGFDCALNPNGGAFDQTTQAGVFWVEKTSQIDTVISDHVSRDGYSIAGWEVSNVDGDLLNVTRQGPQNYRYVGDYSNWTSTGENFDFATQIMAPVYLTAKWLSNAKLSVAYDLAGGTGSIADSNHYFDGAEVAVSVAAPVKDGYQFIGWKVEGVESGLLLPGGVLEINKANNDKNDDNVITLTAVYDQISNVTLTFHGDPSTPNPESVMLGKNEAYDLSDVAVNRSGYTLEGWSKEDGGSVDFFPTTVVATDCDDDLYAVWKKYGDRSIVVDFNGKMVIATEANEPQNVIAKNGVFGLDGTDAYYQLNSGSLKDSTKDNSASLNNTYSGTDFAEIYGKHVGETEKSWKNITVVPASNIYYSDTLVNTKLDVNDQIGYNDGVKHPEVTAASDSKTYSFTFTGTRIDVYATTSKDTGAVTAKLKDSDGNVVKNGMKIINTKVPTDAIRVSAPSVSFSVPSGTYTLEIYANELAYFALEAVRVYNATEDNAAVEPKARYINLRDMVLGKKEAGELTDKTTGALFMDKYTGTNPYEEGTDAYDKYVPDDYTNRGPKNEVYLAKDQSIAFVVPDGVDVMVSARSPETPSGTVMINREPQPVNNVDMYYPVTPDGEGKVVIENTTNDMISVLNVKLTAADDTVTMTLFSSPQLVSSMAHYVGPVSADNTQAAQQALTELIQQILSNFVRALFENVSRLFGK